MGETTSVPSHIFVVGCLIEHGSNFVHIIHTSVIDIVIYRLIAK
jgi:hypothetical protein